MASDHNANANVNSSTEVAVYSLGNVESTFNQNILSIFKTDKWNDVTFVVGPSNNSKEIGGCRVLFACHSQVFDTMLFGKMSESQHKSTVIINDVSPTAFEWLKQYCYGLNPSLNGNNVCEILQISDKYLIEPLSQACMVYIEQYVIGQEKIINMDQFWYLLNSLHKLKLDRKLNQILNSKSLESLNSGQWAELFATKAFLTSSPEVVQLVLKIVNQQRSANAKTDKVIISIERIWYHLIEWCKENFNISVRIGSVNGDGDGGISQVDVGSEDTKQESIHKDVNGGDDSASEKWCGVMKRYFVSQKLIDFKQFDGAFYLQFIDPIAKMLMSSDEIIDVMRHLWKNGSTKMELISKDLEMSEWRDSVGKFKNVKNVALDLKWDQNNHGTGVTFETDYTVQYSNTRAICVGDLVVSPNVYQIFEWEITTHVISDWTWLGYVNAPLKDSINDWNYFLAGKNPDFQRSIGFGNEKKGNFGKSGANILPVPAATTVKENDRFKFQVNFNNKTITLFQNDKECGIIERNVDRAIIPAASNNTATAKYSIRVVGAVFKD